MKSGNKSKTPLLLNDDLKLKTGDYGSTPIKKTRAISSREMGVSIGNFKLVDDQDFKFPALFRELLAELLGTFYLIFIGSGGVGGVILLQLQEKTLQEVKIDSAGLLQIAFAFGLGIGGAVHLFSDISGGHFNPAVSFCLFMAGKISIVKAVLFTIFQIAGGLIGAGILQAMFGFCPGAVAINPGLTVASAFFIEFFGTLFLLLTILATTNSDRKHSPSYLQPLSIGIAIFVLHMFLVPATGCGLNPARCLATNIVDKQLPTSFLIYIFAPLVAAIVGGPLYVYLFGPHYHSHKDLNKREDVYVNKQVAE